MIKFKIWPFLAFIAFAFLPIQKSYAQSDVVNIIFTSDAHFGITRAKFRGDSNVSGDKVNQAMVAQMNSLPGLTLPADGGIGANQRITGVDYVIEGGDIANRMEPPVQSAAASWAQFDRHYMHQLNLKGHDGRSAKLLIVPGNHDISNAIGYARTMDPPKDPSSMVNIYNLMLKPAKPLTNSDYDYKKDKINYSRSINGVHFVFITLWADSAERRWMQKDLDTVLPKTPVIIVTHDQPECESKHFTNPMPPYSMTVNNKFENLAEEHYKEGNVASKDDGATAIEQRGFVKFLKAHPNIKAYFHGNSNWNEFYAYHGPDNDINLNTFRVDSPMKGKYSSKDETQLSFQLISIDPKTQLMTVRECLWDTKPADPNQQIVFGKSATVSLKVK
ncbi:MAG TPA: metallophosphoesterase [Mucilaginibacter sp.]|nr:metallophosphoesterase [Mucilaginibacter sp.]